MKNAWFNWVRYGVAGVFGMRKRCAMNEECSMLNAQSSKGKRTGASTGARWSGRVAAVVAAAVLCVAGAGSSAWGAFWDSWFGGGEKTVEAAEAVEGVADGAATAELVGEGRGAEGDNALDGLKTPKGSVRAAGDIHLFTNTVNGVSYTYSTLLNNNTPIPPINMPEQSYPVSKVSVRCRYNKTAGGATVSVTIGGNPFGTSKTHNSNSTTTLDFEGAEPNPPQAPL